MRKKQLSGADDFEEFQIAQLTNPQQTDVLRYAAQNENATPG